MNRIILIGNGFDLAHGIKTSYCDFIDYYWYKTVHSIQEKSTNELFENSEIKINGVPQYCYAEKSYEGLLEDLKQTGATVHFKNQFLEIINNKKQIQNWVDIENEYYELLKNSFKDLNCRYNISDLNKDFNDIQKLLENHLKEVEEHFKKNFGTSPIDKTLQRDIGNKIYSNFKFKDFSEASINKRAEIEFQKLNQSINDLKIHDVTLNDLSPEKQSLISRLRNNDDALKEIKKLLTSDVASNYFDLKPQEILFLNFNYTFTDAYYYQPNDFVHHSNINKSLEISKIHIHGTTNESDGNNVIFGFGDEIDEDYKSIEKLENKYLDNIKSIKYLETDNYKKLLEFLNLGDYQIYIFGHSCGNSDRLLSTLFEHKHCASIKPFYHKKDEDNDNYSDIIRNITRNFSNKAILRDKVVNKKYCEPLT